jgi:protein required for attachment to host cells
MSSSRWVLVADEAIARIVALQSNGDAAVPVEELTDAAAHADAAEFQRDAQGRRAGGAPPALAGSISAKRGASTATTSAGEGPQHQEAEKFAKRVAQRLDERLRQGRFDDLQIVAAPRFLGLLRKALSPAVLSTVTRQIDKDLVHVGNDEIARRLESD